MSELGAYEPTWDTGLAYGEWTAATVGLARQASAILLVLIGLLLLTIVVMLVVSGRRPVAEEPDPPAPGGRPSGDYSRAEPRVRPPAPAPESTLRLAPEPVAGSTALLEPAAGPPESGLTRLDLLALTALRSRMLAGQVSEGASLPERLAFARWLVEQGRLSG